MKFLKIHCFQHVDFEDIGCIKDWCDIYRHKVTYTRFFQDEPIPNSDDFDWLIIMGGPMNIYDEGKHPWLEKEKMAIRQAITEGKTIIGICLGAQLIADVLGAKVHSNSEKEIGWFNIVLTENGRSSRIFGNTENEFKVFHWHGDSFDLPAGSVHLASSEGYRNQAFLYRDRVLGLQFHLEITEQGLKSMIINGSEELTDQKYIQTGKEMLSQLSNIPSNNQRMFSILDSLSN